MTAGCVVQGIPNICSSTQLRAFYIHPVCTRPSLFCFYPFNRTYTFLTFERRSFSVRRRPQVDVEEFGFLEKIFSKTKPEERTWAKLVNLKTIHWYCDGPKPMLAAFKYEAKIRRRKSVIFTLLVCS